MPAPAIHSVPSYFKTLPTTGGTTKLTSVKSSNTKLAISVCRLVILVFWVICSASIASTLLFKSIIGYCVEISIV